MKALLLAGGLGTRLRPLTERLPKPMAPVGNRPWLEHLVMQLKDQGIREFIIALKHYPQHIRQHFGDGSRFGVSITYTVEKEALGTAGAIKNAEPHLSETFLVLNADVVQHLHLLPLLEFHRDHGGQVTIGLTEVEDPSQFGVVEQTSLGRIVRFVEKPKKEEAPSRLINAGIYVMNRDVLRYIPAGREVSIERETFPLILKQGVGVYGKPIEGYWLDMGTRERYRQVHWDLLDGKLKLPLDGTEKDKGIRIGKNVSVGKGALLIPPVLIGDDVRIGERAVVGPYVVIGNGCEITAKARLSETILWDRCIVRGGAELHRCVFGYDTEIGSGHILYEAVVNRMKEVVTA